MKHPNKAGGFRLSAIFVMVGVLLAAALAGCGGEGPMGNTPSKKPEWSK